MGQHSVMRRDCTEARGAPAIAVAAVSLGLPALFFFLLLGDLAWSLKERALPDLFKFQLREFSQDATLLNVLFGALPSAIAMFIGPVVGAWSDRTRTRFGRRIPFLLACAPLVSASMVGLAFSEPLGDALWQWAGASAGMRGRYIVACMCFFWTFYEIFTVLANALFIALVNDTVPQRIMGRFFGMFRIISLGVGVAFFYFVFGNELPAVARPVMLAIAAAYLAGFLALCKGVREPQYPPPTPAQRASLQVLRGDDGTSPWFYVLLFVTLAIATICVLPVNINSYNAISQFGVDRTDYGRAVAAAYSISIVLAMPVGWLADRFHPLRVGFVTLVLYALSMLGAWEFVAGRMSFLVWFVVHAVLAGTFLTGTAALLPRLLPRTRFSSLAALSASITGLLTVFFTIELGALLDANGRDFHVIFLVAGLLASLGSAFWFVVLVLHRRRQAPADQRS
ncbi:MFS transporter [Pseudoduganella eburnea]|uniref:MFS transporter n=1 Tax=Massilia eburnea TaxID=1776165 RepID=A0A6L6QRE9_9BURK|nr:MFS transporter [Massilia eburnea]MTW14226.1 MFS transporter [Massilia eburnea]